MVQHVGQEKQSSEQAGRGGNLVCAGRPRTSLFSKHENGAIRGGSAGAHTSRLHARPFHGIVGFGPKRSSTRAPDYSVQKVNL